MNLKKYKMYVCIGVLMILLGVNIEAHLVADDGEVFNIVVINSYSPFSPWEERILDSFSETFYKDKSINVNIETEYIDIRRNNNQEYIEIFREMLNTKRKNRQIDLIVAIDNEATQMMKEEVLNPESAFYQIPMVYFSTDLITELTREERDYIVGIGRYNHLNKLINWIIELDQDVEGINLIMDEYQYDKYLKGDEYNVERMVYTHLDVNIIAQEYIQDVEAALSAVSDKNQVNIVVGTYKDYTTGNYIGYEEVVKRIKEVKDIPIYSLIENYAEAGATGAIVTDIEEQGAELAEMAIKVLKGKPISEIPIQRRLADKYVLDYKQIHYYNLEIHAIPQDSELLNKRFYQVLMPKEISILIGVVVSIGLIVTLRIAYMLFKQRQEIKKSQEVYHLYEETKEREQLKTDFLVNMSHEFRTPINVILSTVELLKSYDKQVDKVYLDSKLHSIAQNSNRVLRLVNNMIDAAKLEAGSYQARFINCNIVEVVENSILGTAEYIKQKGLELVFDTEEEEIITAIDRGMIERVILNLIANAIKFTPRGGKISSCIIQEEDQVVIQIIDTGIGIAKEKIDFIFHKFYQVDNTLYRGSEGSGIGLCIVKEMIAMHDGEISVMSTEGKGTEVLIKLPIKVLADSETMDKSEYSHLGQAVKIELSDVYIE